MILRSFGFENNGLMQSVDQILGYTVLLESGIGGVMRAALYRPLADNDTKLISDIFHSGKRFFCKISFFILFVVAVKVSLVGFPLFAVMNFLLQPKRMKTFLTNIR